MDPRKVLAGIYALRGLSLVILPMVTTPAGMFLFAVVYGLDWFATVPPVVAIAGNTFGKNSVGSIYGWIFLAHQLGGAPWPRPGLRLRLLRPYTPAFLSGAVLAALAVLMSMSIARDRPRPTLPTPEPGLAAT